MDASLLPWAAAVAGAALMAFGLPPANVALLTFVGAALLFWAWLALSVGRAFLAGWLAGTIYFAAAFSWFGETAGAYIAPFGFALVLAPAVIEGFAFAVTGALVALAAGRADARFAPLAGAAAFAVLEWLRSNGPLAVPFGNLAYTQVQTPLAPLGAFVGSFGVTFAVCVLAAYAASALLGRGVPGTRAAVATAYMAVLASVAAAWLLWPARHAPPPTVHVAAIQGNIPQGVKWIRASFDLANARYEAMTREAALAHPALILWPETVVTIDLNLDPPLVAHIGALARASHAELIVGAKQLTPRGEYNALYYFRPDGGLEAIYGKRRLVPFVEALPAPWLLGRLPVASLVSRFLSGTWTGVTNVAGLRFAPMICWESAFDGVAHEAVRDGAQAFVVATDDAWFGETAGPYQHAQIAQMRAIETGAWVLRSAATGISGIIAPSGRYTRESRLNQVAIVTGIVGRPATTLYASLGALPIGAGLALLYIALVARRRPA
jgi:apolipoprotein N-acyltransferase